MVDIWPTTDGTHRAETRLAFISSPSPGPSRLPSIILNAVRISDRSRGTHNQRSACLTRPAIPVPVMSMSKHLELRWNTLDPVDSPPTRGCGSKLGPDGFLEIYKRVEVHSLISSAAVQLTPVLLSYLPDSRPGAFLVRSSSRHPISSCSSKLLSPSLSSGFSPSTR